MQYAAGEIYFVREKDRTGKKTNFVKIGLVRYSDHRDSFGRLLEHQTGNPRKLFLNEAEIVKTNAVDKVEAQLHRFFAKNRVSGEWFEFEDESFVNNAVKKAQSLASSMSDLGPIFAEAARLDNQVSTLGERPASEAELELGKNYLLAKERGKKVKSLVDRIEELLFIAYREGWDVSQAAEVKVKTYAPKFMEAEFEKQHPDLYEEYSVQTSSWKHTFLMKLKLTGEESLGEDFLSEFAHCENVVSAVTSHEQFDLLNEPRLTLIRLAGEATLDEEIAKAKLQQSMGLHSMLTGLVAWERISKKSKKFDSDLLASEMPDLAKQYLTEPKQRTYVKAKKTKN